MDNITELYAIYYVEKLSPKLDVAFANYFFIGTFTSEAFAVEGFQEWIKGRLNPKHISNELLIENIEKCSSIKTINDVLFESQKGLSELRSFRHKPNEILNTRLNFKKPMFEVDLLTK